MKLNPDGSSSRSLDDRAADALVRIKVGYAPMQIPPDDADADLVITAMRARLAAQEIELTRRAQSEQELRERVDEYKREVERRDEMISGDAHMLAEARALVKALEADGLRVVAERDEARATAELHQKALEKAQAERDDCSAENERCHELLDNALGLGGDGTVSADTLKDRLKALWQGAVRGDLQCSKCAALAAEAAMLKAALKKMARCWTGNTFSPPNYYMGHSETCGGKGNDAACSCASNQSRGAFIRGREAIEAALAPRTPEPTR